MPEWIGKTIGRVRIDKYLARGGMAEVYLGSHLSLDRLVAVKVLHSYIEEDPGLLTRFQREAKVVAALRHPNIVQIYDFDATEGHPYIVMEYLKGPTLSSYLRRLHERNERIPTHQVARLLKALTSALDYAHEQGVIHRDIKPANIMLHGKADEIPLDQPLTSDVEAILTDFGLVRIEHAASQTASGMVSGTPSYMSPEQARGDKTDHRTDIYSLGVVLYEMLAGRVPFEADSTMSVMYMQINEPPPAIPGVNSALQAVINRALAKNPNDRYQTCREMALDFFLALGMTAEAETIIETLPEDSPRRTEMAIKSEKPKSAKPNRSPMVIGIAIVSVICIIGVAIGAMKVFSNLSPSSNVTETQSPVSTDSTSTVPATVAVSSGPPSSEGMVEIPADTYEVGTTTPQDEFHSAPTSIALSGFWIDKYQITNTEFQQYLTATAGQPPEVWPNNSLNQPVRGVTWDQAVAYCTWKNKRLPKEAEWEAAGRGSGPNPQEYPWGNDYSKAADLPVDDAYDVGTQSFNQSPFGVFDLVGNVWEWVGEPYADIQTGFHILRGGRYGNAQDLSYRVSAASNDPAYIKFVGFRCAADQVK